MGGFGQAEKDQPGQEADTPAGPAASQGNQGAHEDRQSGQRGQPAAGQPGAGQFGESGGQDIIQRRVEGDQTRIALAGRIEVAAPGEQPAFEGFAAFDGVGDQRRGEQRQPDLMQQIQAGQGGYGQGVEEQGSGQTGDRPGPVAAGGPGER